MHLRQFSSDTLKVKSTKKLSKNRKVCISYPEDVKLQELEIEMEKLPDALRPGGRVAILTFHSGEDKLVKKALKAGYKEGIYSDYAKDVIRPSAKECTQNPSGGIFISHIQCSCYVIAIFLIRFCYNLNRV